MFTLTSAKLTGNPSPSGWVQADEFEKKLFVVVSAQDASLGIEILSRFQKEYFEKNQETPYLSLKEATEKIVSGFSSQGIDIELSAILVAGNITYSSAGGGGQILLFRGNTLSKILASAKGEVITASGYPKEDDLLIASTKEFLQEVSIDLINSSLAQKDPVKGVENLAPAILGKEDSGKVGAVIIRFAKESLVSSPSASANPTDFIKPINNLFGNLANNLKRLIPKREIYIKSDMEDIEAPQKRKMAVSVGIILLVLLLVSIVFGIRQRKINITKAQYEGTLTQAEHDFDESYSLLTLNPERSRELFASSLSAVNLLVSQKISDLRITTLKNKLDSNEGLILGEYKASPELFIDLSLLSSGFNGDDISMSNGKIFVLDKKAGKIAGIAVSTKKSSVIAGPDQVQNADSIAAYEDKVFILASTGIYQVGSAKTKVIDPDWTGQPMVYAFSGNLYVLDSSGIWRYQGSGSASTFGSKQAWLAKGTKADWGSAKAWTIDGSVYAAVGSGKVLKFSLGSPQNFSTSGITPPLSNIDSIFSSDETKFVYVLDRQGKRVVVLGKDGTFKAQYTSDAIGEAKDIAVSEADKKIILLTGAKLLSIETKHI